MSPGSRQHGAALAVGLVFLLVLTLLAVSALRTSLLEERVAGGVQDASVALQAAEAALREGEALLLQEELPPFDGSVAGLYGQAAADAAPRWSTLDWNQPGAARPALTFAGAPPPLDRVQASYIVEALPPATDAGHSLVVDAAPVERRYFRVTARAAGVAGEAEAIVQSTFER